MARKPLTPEQSQARLEQLARARAQRDAHLKPVLVNQNKGNDETNMRGPNDLDNPDMEAGAVAEEGGAVAEEGGAVAEEEEDDEFPRIQTLPGGFRKADASRIVNDYRPEEDLPESILSGEEFHDTSRPVPGVNSMRERREPGWDMTSVTSRIRKLMGIEAHEEPCWVLRENWMNMGGDDPGDFLDRNEGARIPLDARGKPFTRKDLVLACRPKVEVAEIERRNLDRALEAKDRDEHGIPSLSESEMRDLRKANEDYLNQLLHGSPTQGKTLEQAGRIMSAQDVRNIQRQYMSPRARGVPDSAWDNVKDVAAETGKAASRGRSTHAIGASFDANGKLVRA